MQNGPERTEGKEPRRACDVVKGAKVWGGLLIACFKCYLVLTSHVAPGRKSNSPPGIRIPALQDHHEGQMMKFK